MSVALAYATPLDLALNVLHPVFHAPSLFVSHLVFHLALLACLVHSSLSLPMLHYSSGSFLALYAHDKVLIG